MDKTDRAGGSDQDIGRILRAAGRRKQLPDDRKAVWEAQFRKELEAQRLRRTRRRQRIVGGLAATVAIIAVALSGLSQRPPPFEPVIRISAITGDAILVDPSGKERQLARGNILEMNSVLTTGKKGFVSVAYAGYDLRINAESQLEFGAGEIALSKGEIYANDNEQRIGQIQLKINTPFGWVRDIGTQFTVAVGQDGTVTTVRRGTVVVNTGAQEYQATAEPDTASQLHMDSQQQVHITQVPPSGQEWRWIYQARPAYSLEGSTALQFLQWSVGESGLALEFASGSAEVYARRTTLHGDFGHLTPEKTVAPVLASTSLTAVVSGNTLKVSLQR